MKKVIIFVQEKFLIFFRKKLHLKMKKVIISVQKKFFILF